MTLEPKIERDVAKADADRWLDLKRIPLETRKVQGKFYEKLISAIMHDAVSIDDKGIITHKLNFPIENAKGDIVCAEFKYKPRLTVDEIEACAQAGGDTRVYGSALTSNNAVPSDYFGRMDTTDLGILAAVVVFFTC